MRVLSATRLGVKPTVQLRLEITDSELHFIVNALDRYGSSMSDVAIYNGIMYFGIARRLMRELLDALEKVSQVGA